MDPPCITTQSLLFRVAIGSCAFNCQMFAHCKTFSFLQRISKCKPVGLRSRYVASILLAEIFFTVITRYLTFKGAPKSSYIRLLAENSLVV